MYVIYLVFVCVSVVFTCRLFVDECCTVYVGFVCVRVVSRVVLCCRNTP